MDNRRDMKKQELIEKLIKVCFKLDDNYIRQKEKTERLSRMAQLARAGQKDSEEFKRLDCEIRNPTVIDSSDEYVELHRIVTKLKK